MSDALPLILKGRLIESASEALALLPEADRLYWEKNDPGLLEVSREDLGLALRGKCLDCGHSVNRHDVGPVRLGVYIGTEPGCETTPPRHGFRRLCLCDWLTADPEGVNLA